MFAVIGVQIFNGRLHSCTDYAIAHQAECTYASSVCCMLYNVFYIRVKCSRVLVNGGVLGSQGPLHLVREQRPEQAEQAERASMARARAELRQRTQRAAHAVRGVHVRGLARVRARALVHMFTCSHVLAAVLSAGCCTTRSTRRTRARARATSRARRWRSSTSRTSWSCPSS